MAPQRVRRHAYADRRHPRCRTKSNRCDTGPPESSRRWAGLRGVRRRRGDRTDLARGGAAIRGERWALDAVRDRGVPTPQVLRYQDCETWLGRRPSTEVDRAAFLKRYLAAFGAGTEHDLTYFSGVGNWREVIDSCESALTWLEGPQGERLMDLKGLETLQSAQDVCRLVPRYDNIIYAYKDRSRFGWGRSAACALGQRRLGSGEWTTCRRMAGSLCS
jgi:hypothetical protein